MPKDHFVARTYLKHFGDAKLGGMLHAYSKSNGIKFPCWPKDVCHEWDGDLNPSFLDPPELLGDFRKIFEPHWNPAIEHILGGAVSNFEKFVVSAYMANLMICTPSWRRVGTEHYNQATMGSLTFSQKMNEKHGKADDLLTEGIEMLKQGQLKLETDQNYVKAKVTQQLLANALVTYNQNWLLLSNETEHPFVTSDNPVAIEYSGKPGEFVTRFLPITPHLCLQVTYSYRKEDLFDLKKFPENVEKPPNGIIKRGKIKPTGAKYINRLIVQCAEALVFSSQESVRIANLVQKYSQYRVEADYVELPTGEENSLYQGTIIRVQKRTK